MERRIRVLRETLEKLGVDTSANDLPPMGHAIPQDIQYNNLPIARGYTSKEINLGYEIITPNRLKLGRNNFRSLEGNGIELQMLSNFTKILDRNHSIYQQWYKLFINNIHYLNLHPNKWLKSSRLTVVSDIVNLCFK